VIHTDTLATGLSYFNHIPFDLILLDLSLPDFDGFELLREKRSAEIPVIVISAYSDTATKVRAFRYGAVDYMVKPIDLLELEARIWSHLSRVGKLPPQNEQKEKSLFEIRDHALYSRRKRIALTPVEFEIFALLLKNRDRTISRERLTEALSPLSSQRTLDYHIKNIRTKIGDTEKPPRYLKTEYGIGYRLTF
jgi:DNA-binding response OmpR family regulator